MSRFPHAKRSAAVLCGSLTPAGGCFVGIPSGVGDRPGVEFPATRD
ncbi:hypothetical protein ABT263_14605 [Kitasatospora sp. NPDC001603]